MHRAIGFFLNGCVVLLAILSFPILNCSEKKAQKSHKYLIFGSDGTYLGLSDYSKDLLSTSKAALQQMKVIFKRDFKQFESLFHAAYVNRLIKGNMFLYGPPGGAKSKFVKWIFDHEQVRCFEIQLHQMMTEHVFVGGQSFAAAQEGRFEITTEGSMAHATLGLVDEFDKGNPATLAALLSLLNERKVLAGGKVIPSTLETIFSTSNANMYEIDQLFYTNGMRSTASALLNRFTSKAFVPNWLPPKDQAELDNNYMGAFDALYSGNIDAAQNAELKPAIIDWQGLRELAYCLFRPNEAFFSAFRELVNRLRTESIENQSLLDGSVPLFSTVEYTERLRQKLHDVVIMSLFLDLLTSPIMDDIPAFENILKRLRQHRIVVEPRSLWRAYIMLTTVTFGSVRFVLPTHNNDRYDIDFGHFFSLTDGDTDNVYKGKDEIEQKNINDIIKEQQQFKYAVLQIIEQAEDTRECFAMNDALFNFSEIQDLQTIERVLSVLSI